MSLTRRRLLPACAAVLALLGHAASSAGAADAPEKRLAVLRAQGSAAFEAVHEGLLDGLRERGHAEGDSLTILSETADDSLADAGRLAQKLVGLSPDAIVAIGARPAQVVASLTRDVPVIFTAVADPASAGLAGGTAPQRENLTGVSMLPRLDRHLGMIREVLPDARVIGVPYNPMSDSSSALLERLRARALDTGFSLLTASITRPEDLGPATRRLVGRVDAIYVPTDAAVIDGLDTIIEVSEENAIPVFSGDAGSVARGAIAAMGFDYRDVGVATAEVVARVLEGEAPASIPVTGVDGGGMVVNPAAARRMGTPLSEDTLARAARIVGD